jgi:hypothetical protein
MLCICDNLSVCVKFAYMYMYVDAMLYLCMQYFMLYRFYVYGICSFSDADLCVRNFFCVCNKLHCGMGKWRHLPNCNNSCDWSNHLRCAGNPHPSSSMYLMILACGLRGPIKTWQWHDSFPRVEWCMKCIIFRYQIREAVTKYDGDVITANRTWDAIYFMHINFLHTWM